MKVLRKGDRYKNQFVGKVVLCRDCKSILQIERRDLMKRSYRSIDDRKDRDVHCPVCFIDFSIKARTLRITEDVLKRLASHI